MRLDASEGATAEQLQRTIRRAAELLEQGALVAVPTETVYGVAVRADLPGAVDRLYRLKGRPPDRSMTIHLADGEPATIGLHAPPLPTVARRLARRYWPGPLTLVVPGHQGQLVGLRVPDHDLLRAILARVHAPVLIPSANPTGQPPASSAEQVEAYFGPALGGLVDGGPLPPREASSVVLVRPGSWELLREGAIPADRVAEAALALLLFCCTGNTCRSPMAEVLAHALLSEASGHEDLHQVGVEIASAGLAAGAGARASAEAMRAVQRRGLSLAEHRSTPLTRPLARSARRILVMTQSHLAAVEELVGAGAVELLRPDGADIVDPFGAPDSVYERTCEEISEALQRRLGELLEVLDLTPERR